MISPRIAPAMVGMGLLEAVPEEAILRIAERQEKLGVRRQAQLRVGLRERADRAGPLRLESESAQPAPADRRRVSRRHRRDHVHVPGGELSAGCRRNAWTCRRRASAAARAAAPATVPARGDPEPAHQHHAVPAGAGGAGAAQRERRRTSKRGEALFAQAQCSVCHMPELKTGAKPALTAAADITLHPYTDLLLHDMGEELADGRPDFKASGREWRTPPLWGIGLLRTVNGHGDLLHDGRARNVTEAILWHGGQAQTAREAFSDDAEGGSRGAGEVRRVALAGNCSHRQVRSHAELRGAVLRYRPTGSARALLPAYGAGVGTPTTLRRAAPAPGSSASVPGRRIRPARPRPARGNTTPSPPPTARASSRRRACTPTMRTNFDLSRSRAAAVQGSSSSAGSRLPRYSASAVSMPAPLAAAAGRLARQPFERECIDPAQLRVEADQPVLDLDRLGVSEELAQAVQGHGEGGAPGVGLVVRPQGVDQPMITHLDSTHADQRLEQKQQLARRLGQHAPAVGRRRTARSGRARRCAPARAIPRSARLRNASRTCGSARARSHRRSRRATLPGTGAASR